MDANTRRLVHELHADGESNRAIAKRIGVSHPTVAKVLAEPPPATPRRHQRPDDTSEDDTIDPTAPALDVVRELLAAGRRDLAEARAIGDRTTAQRLTRDCSGLTVALARLEKAEQADEGSVTINAGEVRQIEELLEENFGALVQRAKAGGGLLCSKCHRELAIDLAGARGMGIDDKGGK